MTLRRISFTQGHSEQRLDYARYSPELVEGYAKRVKL